MNSTQKVTNVTLKINATFRITKIVVFTNWTIHNFTQQFIFFIYLPLFYTSQYTSLFLFLYLMGLTTCLRFIILIHWFRSSLKIVKNSIQKIKIMKNIDQKQNFKKFRIYLPCKLEQDDSKWMMSLWFCFSKTTTYFRSKTFVIWFSIYTPHLQMQYNLQIVA